MKPKKKMKRLRITEKDFLLAHRRAARMEEIQEHGRPVSYRTALHKSKKVYDRKRLKKAGITSDDLPFSSAAEEDEYVEVVVEGGVAAEELAGVL